MFGLGREPARFDLRRIRVVSSVDAVRATTTSRRPLDRRGTCDKPSRNRCCLPWHFYYAFRLFAVRKGGNVPEPNSNAGGLDVLRDDKSDTVVDNAAAIADKDAPVADGQPEARQAPNETDEVAAKNAADLAAALKWMECRPLGVLHLQRQLMECLRTAQEKNWKVHSEHWEFQQTAVAARNILNGKDQWLVRDFALLQYAKGETDKPFLERLDQLHKDDFWETLPQSCCTVEYRALLFSLMSKMGCGFFDFIVCDRLDIPIAIFVLLTSEAAVVRDRLTKIPRCLWDEESLQLEADHPALDGEEFYAKLLMRLHRARKDNSISEVTFASIRRMLVTRSTQTSRMSFEDLNSEWMCINARLNDVPTILKKRKPLKTIGKRKRVVAKKSRCGGPWRVCVNKQRAGKKGKTPWKTLSREYRKLQPAEKQQLIEEGRKATREARTERKAGRKAMPLGVKPSILRRRQATKRREAESAELLKLSAPERQRRIREWSERDHGGLDRHAHITRTVHRFASTVKKQEDEKDFADIRRYHEQVGLPLVREMLECASLSEDVHAFRSVPLSPKLPCFEPVPQAQEVVGNAVGWASSAKATKLAPTLGLQWDWVNTMLEETDCPVEEDDHPQNAVSACRKLRFCVCCESGRLIGNMAMRFLRILKAGAPPGSRERDLVNDASAVVFRKQCGRTYSRLQLR